MELGAAYPMKGGQGPYSYAQNSSYQREAVADAKNKIHDAIVNNFVIDKSLKLSTGSNSIRIADFGCSTGPNTFEAMQHITEVVYKKYNTTMNLRERHKPLEFQVFFNDQVNNDFNTLFATLPRTSPKYFVAAAPGSFHGRLFPQNTLHIGFSSCTLHWLSRIPEDIQNKGSIYFTGNDMVFEAYSAQHKKDMDSFLSARAQEMIEGGLLLLSLPHCLKEYGNYTSKTQFGVKCELLGSCLMDMANMGMISKEKVETFNLPMYFPSLVEWSEIIESNGHFSIEMIEPSLPSRPHISSNHLRAGLEQLLAHHFGEHIIDHLFDLHSMKMEEIPTCDIEATFTVFACLKLKSKLCE